MKLILFCEMNCCVRVCEYLQEQFHVRNGRKKYENDEVLDLSLTSPLLLINRTSAHFQLFFGVGLLSFQEKNFILNVFCAVSEKMQLS